MKRFSFKEPSPLATSATSATSATQAEEIIQKSQESQESQGVAPREGSGITDPIAKARLDKAAKHYGADVADLLDWYREDLPMIAEMPSKQLAWAIEDYLTNKDSYRRKK